jgi:hypothetical protein
MSAEAQQPELVGHERLVTALPDGSLGPVSLDHDRPPSFETTRGFRVLFAPTGWKSTPVQRDASLQDSEPRNPPRAGTLAETQVMPPSLLYRAEPVGSPVAMQLPEGKHWTCAAKNRGGRFIFSHVRPRSSVTNSTERTGKFADGELPGGAGGLDATMTQELAVVHESPIGPALRTMHALVQFEDRSFIDSASGAGAEAQCCPPSLVHEK